jgi:hypothetical protein
MPNYSASSEANRVMNILGFAILIVCAPIALLDFAIPKWKADKNVRIDDAYKYLYQATRGGEHAAPNREMARKWLESEWASLGKPEANEPLWEPLCKDGPIGRLNLRVFKAKRGKMDDLLDAFLASSREYKETGTGFIDTWNELGKRLKRRPIGSLTYEEWSRFDAEMKAKNYPAVHHSKEFEEAHRPAYRILTRAQARPLVADR